jgi:hypothetical protein
MSFALLKFILGGNYEKEAHVFATGCRYADIHDSICWLAMTELA